MRYATIDSPIGPLLLAQDESGVRQIQFLGSSEFEIPIDWTRSDRALGAVRKQLEEYFEGGRTTFDLELAPEGTEFQKSVWNALLTIPFGETVSYLDIATRLGNPAAVRAVGAANGSNPIPIVIPCHRVIGTDGSLTGYGGGIETKKWLLEHEGAEPRGQLGLF